MSNLKDLDIGDLSTCFRMVNRLSAASEGIAGEAHLQVDQASLAPEALAGVLTDQECKQIAEYAKWLARVGKEAQMWQAKLDGYGQRLCDSVDMPGALLSDPMLSRMMFHARQRATLGYADPPVDMGDPCEPPF